MKKVKVIKIYDTDYIDYDNYSLNIADQTDWVTVSDEEFDLLKNGLHRLNKGNTQLKLIEELDYNSIKISIDSIRTELAELNRLEEERQAKNRAKYEKSRKTAEENKRKKELKILEELKKKYQEGV